MAPTGIDKDRLLFALSKAGHDVLFNTALREKLPIQHLAQAKKGISSELEKEFMLSRQVNLRAGIAAFKELQRVALM
jgi:hypothetical protein